MQSSPALLALIAILGVSCTKLERHALHGRITLPGGRPASGALVTARVAGGTTAVTRYARRDGSYVLGGLAAGRHVLEVRAGGAVRRDTVELDADAVRCDVRIDPAQFEQEDVRSSAWLGLLTDGEEERRFILDCTGCHIFDARIARRDGQPRSRDDWNEAVQRMRSFAGASSGFPVMSAHRDTFHTADWLVQQLADRQPLPSTSTGRRGEAEIREFDLPESGDLPHDLAIDRDGRVVVTGMFTHRMYVVDPVTGAVSLDSIPTPKANPRAVEIDARGNWWVVLGGPQRIARRDTSGRWESWPVGVYAHSLALTGDGRVWSNGHFTRDPELLVMLDPAIGDTASRAVFPHATLATVPGGPVPYELRAADDGRVWLSELQGNRIVMHNPATAAFATEDMPMSFSGPRRFDIDAEGMLWIPTYASNALVRFDSASNHFESFPLPNPDSAPYVARVDRTHGTVWVGTAASDEILAFDPRTREFTSYPLPTRGALIRHIAVDERRNEIWAAYGASPGLVPARIARLRPMP